MLDRLKQLISVAKGERPADLILSDARIVNTLNGEIERTNIAIFKERIAGIGDYCEAKEIIDLNGQYVVPGFIDGHTHLESSMLDVGEYAGAIVPHGTLGIVTDLHEIANVCGVKGMRYILNYARQLPFDLFLMAPSGVPATNLEASGFEISPNEVKNILRWRQCLGLGEVMNYPGVLEYDNSILAKICLAQGSIIDGHAPGLSSKLLNAYIAAGVRSDHESTTVQEAKEKLGRGMFIMIREGSSEKNLETLLPLVNDYTYRRCFFVIDDCNCADLLRHGEIDAVLRKAIGYGLDPVRAIQMVTINPAEYFRLENLGAVAPGYFANLLVLSSLAEIRIEEVFYHGLLVARRGEALFSMPRKEKGLRGTINIQNINTEALKLPSVIGEIPVIEIISGQILTRKIMVKPTVLDGLVVPDIQRDLLKLAVVERHKGTGKLGLGLVKGLGLKMGAIASSIAHDSHNIVAAGTSDEDILIAVNEIQRLQGGLVTVNSGKVLGSLALPIAGLLSEEPLQVVARKLEHLEKQVKDLGSTIPSPFATLSFLALPVIPEIRLTVGGLVDVE